MRVALLLLLVAAPLLAQRPVLRVDPEQVDLGTFRGGTPQLATFTLANTGGGTLRITRIQGSCGCTTPDVDTLELSAGTQHRLKVIVRTEELKGRFRKTLNLESNDVHSPSVELVITGEAQEPRPRPAEPRRT